MDRKKLDGKKRILVVEDIETFRESYIANLEMEDYKVSGASTLKEAIEAVNSCTFHVAVVDIVLSEKKISNRDGVEVVRYIRDLKEGTQVIVLSLLEDTQLERDLLKEYDIFDYIPKASKGGISHLLKRVKTAIEACPLDGPLSWEGLVGSIAWPVDSNHFIAECLTRLEFKGGFQTLSRALIAACKAAVPLLRENATDQAVRFDPQRRVFHGRFWSKAQNTAIELLFWDKHISGGSNATESLMGRRSVLYQPKEKGGLSVAIVELPELSRSDFLHS